MDNNQQEQEGINNIIHEFNEAILTTVWSLKSIVKQDDPTGQNETESNNSIISTLMEYILAVVKTSMPIVKQVAPTIKQDDSTIKQDDPTAEQDDPTAEQDDPTGQNKTESKVRIISIPDEESLAVVKSLKSTAEQVGPTGQNKTESKVRIISIPDKELLALVWSLRSTDEQDGPTGQNKTESKDSIIYTLEEVLVVFMSSKSTAFVLVNSSKSAVKQDDLIDQYDVYSMLEGLGPKYELIPIPVLFGAEISVPN